MSSHDQIIITDKPLDLSTFNRQIQQADGRDGAAVIFTGMVRGGPEDNDLTGMLLEHYPGMTEKQLQRILDDARNRWVLGDILVVHRVGKLKKGEPIVFVGVSASHRKEAFEACEFIMDYLKTRATFWKKEIFAQSEVWVDAKASDESAAARWS